MENKLLCTTVNLYTNGNLIQTSLASEITTGIAPLSNNSEVITARSLVIRKTRMKPGIFKELNFCTPTETAHTQPSLYIQPVTPYPTKVTSILMTPLSQTVGTLFALQCVYIFFLS